MTITNPAKAEGHLKKKVDETIISLLIVKDVVETL